MVDKHSDQDIDALPVYEDVPQVLLLDQPGQSHCGSLLDDGIAGNQGVYDLVQHLALYPVLQPLQGLLHAVARWLDL